MKVILASSEVTPYAKTGGLADVAGSLPKALIRTGVEVLTVLPHYGSIDVKARVIDDLEVPFGFGTKRASVWADDAHGFPVYFLDLPEYFGRPGIYGDAEEGEYRDNPERFGFFSRAVLEFARRIGLRPDVIHCNDWQTGLLPLYLRARLGTDPFFAETATLFSIHNLAYQGLFDPGLLTRMGLGPDVYDTPAGIEFHGAASSMKAGILTGTGVSTVSRRYAEEIQTPEYGCRLDGLLRSRRNDLVGILNGIDHDLWDPGKDRFLARTYSPENLAGKAECRREVLQMFNLKGDTTWPIVACISRFAAQKGFELITEIAGRMLQLGLHFVVLGSGDQNLESFFQGLRDAHPDRVGVYLGFSNELAHKIEAGADMFLMPSRYEPCGLNQMYSLRYGTVPIVRATGGLDDTVQDFDRSTLQGNGFKFSEYQADRLLEKIREALLVYADRPLWETLMRNGMRADFSWDRSALEYLRVYARLRSAVAI